MIKNWIVRQKWQHVVFLHYKIEKDFLQSLLPEGLVVDCYQGDAFVSIVPFHMSHIRFPFSPILPFANLWELNLRTYVRYGDQVGIYFFTLDTDHPIGQWIAKNIFHLPYRIRPLWGAVGEWHYEFLSRDSFHMSLDIGESMIVSELSSFLSERYHLFTDHHGEIYRGDVFHKPWPLKKVSNLKIDDQFSQEFLKPFKLSEPMLTSYTESLDVYFKPFVRLRRSVGRRE